MAITKVDLGSVVGPKGEVGAQGPAGADGLTTKINLNGSTFSQSGGTISLPTLAVSGHTHSNLFQIEITFDTTLGGEPYSVTGENFVHNGTAPFNNGTLLVSVANANAMYTVVCGKITEVVETSEYFGIYPVLIDATPAVLNEASWAQISSAVARNKVPETWAIGSEKNITLTTGEVLTLQIYGKNHDDLTNGGKAALTFGLKNLMTANRPMNNNNTNVGGFAGSALYTWLQDTLFNSFPVDLCDAIKTVNKMTSAGNNSSTININAMKIFLFSEVECFGTTQYSAVGEGVQYPIFTDNTSRIKKQSNGAGSSNYWWERSPYPGNNVSFCTVFRGGEAEGTNGANVSLGVCFGFCI